MLAFCSSIAFFSFMLTVVGIGSSTNTTATTNTNTNTCGSSSPAFHNGQDDRCSLYLAPSTIPGANLGIFTTNSMKPHQRFPGGDVALPLMDLDQHAGNEGQVHHFQHYTWQANALGMEREAIHGDGICPGLYAATNCWLPLVNIDGSMPVYDTAGLHRARDAGAGAITPYHNASIWAIATIPAGGELFINYGDSWFLMRKNEFGLVPLAVDYPIAEMLISKFASIASRLSYEARTSLWTLIKSVPYESRICNAFPHTLNDADIVAREGMMGLHQPRHVRSLEYLQRHGACLDLIAPGLSSIDQAGRGAFATRAVSQGQIITTAPLLHVPFRADLFTMYEKLWYFEEDDWEWERDHASKPVGEQVIVNYCFGHVESTLLLCPYSSGVGYINHSSEAPNVKIQWTMDGRIGHQDKYLGFEIKDFVDNVNVGLAIDFVALRTIQKGEELLMDYGDAWENAWNDHVASWTPVNDADRYEHAGTWNEAFKESPIRTEDEQELDPYPSHIRIHCHASVLGDNWRIVVEHLGDHLWKPGETGIFCSVHQRRIQNGRLVYDVELDNGFSFRRNVPRIALVFADENYSTDLHLPNLFRFPMQLRDEMVPDQWRNLRTRAS
jgi:hypothetical protein